MPNKINRGNNDNVYDNDNQKNRTEFMIGENNIIFGTQDKIWESNQLDSFKV